MRASSKLVYPVIAAIFIAISASAQEGGKDDNGLKARVDAVFAQYDKSDSPGCALGVIKDGKLLYARGYGMANLEHNIPNSQKLVYDIGSTSKQFAAASVLLLAQQGKLSLDDEARKHIPELPAYQKPITIRHLLHHTSGLRDYLTLFSLAGMNFDDTTTEKDALDIIVRQKGLNFTPGDGAVQTSIEDLSLWDQNFYEPKVGSKAFLEQMHAVGALNNGEKHDYASGLMIGEYKGLRRVSHGGAWAGYRAELARFPDHKFSVACLCNLGSTNPSALAMRVADIFLAEPIKALELKKAKEIEAMTKGGLTGTVVIAEEKLKDKAGVYRSLTNGELRRVTFRDGKLRIDAFAQLSFELKPFSETQFNITGQEGAMIEFKAPGGKPQLHLSRNNRKPDTFEKVEAFEPSAERLSEFAGSYFSEELNTTYKMSVEGGRLFVINRNDAKRPLAPTIRDSFAVISGPQFEFSRDAAGKVAGFAVHAGRIRNVRFSKSNLY